MTSNGHYACSRCYEAVDPGDYTHICADRRESPGGSATVLLSDDYRTEMRDLLDDPIVHDMAEGLGNVPFPELMHDGGAARFETMLAANAEYRSRGGSASWSMGGVSKALIALLIVRREREVRERIAGAIAESKAAEA